MIDFQNPDFVTDPYPELAELRKVGKPIWHEGLQLFLAATHADSSAVLRRPTFVLRGYESVYVTA
jgi:hypothetical protein